MKNFLLFASNFTNVLTRAVNINYGSAGSHYTVTVLSSLFVFVFVYFLKA